MIMPKRKMGMVKYQRIILFMFSIAFPLFLDNPSPFDGGG
jgi:hypothetical protein